MDAEKKSQMESRLRRVTEQLYGDSRLRDGLTDEQAEKLLGWSVRQAEREIERTLGLPEEEAEAAVDEQLEAVKSVARQVNQITGDLQEASKGRTHEYLTGLVDSLCEVNARAVQINDLRALEQLAGARDTLDGEQVFQKLMEIIEVGDEEE